MISIASVEKIGIVRSFYVFQLVYVGTIRTTRCVM